MTLVRAKPGGWAFLELLTSAQVNAMDLQLPYALDGHAGGGYTPSAGLILDGAAIAGADYTLKVKDTPTHSAMRIEATNGFGQALSCIGGAFAASGDPQPLAFLTGSSNSGGNGGVAVKGVGGLCSLAFNGSPSLKRGGLGGWFLGQNGPGNATWGGIGLQAEGGASNFNTYGSTFGGSPAAQFFGGDVTNASIVTHFGGVGVYAEGGDISGSAGKAGSAIFGKGGFSNGSFTGLFGGEGVVGWGYSGVLGMNANMSAFPLSAEFGAGTLENGDMRSGLRAVAKTSGRALITEFSGGSNKSDINKLRWIGDAGFQNNMVLLHVEMDNTNAGSGSIGIKSWSQVASSQFLGGVFLGKGLNSMLLIAQSDGSQISASLSLGGQTMPQIQYSGDFYNLTLAGGPSGTLDDSIYMGSGSGRNYFDRVVGSGDRCAAQGWATITTNGAGGATLVADYGVASVTLIGTPKQIKVTLNTIPGQPSSANICPIVQVQSTNNDDSAIAQVFSSTEIDIKMFNAGGQVDLAGVSQTFNLVWYGIPQYGTAADRPTYVRP